MAAWPWWGGAGESGNVVVDQEDSAGRHDRDRPQ